jgi:hypothetical protein
MYVVLCAFAKEKNITLFLYSMEIVKATKVCCELILVERRHLREGFGMPLLPLRGQNGKGMYQLYKELKIPLINHLVFTPERWLNIVLSR